MRRLLPSASRAATFAVMAAGLVAACADADPAAVVGPPPAAAPVPSTAPAASPALYWETFNFAESAILNTDGSFASWAFIPPRVWRPTDFDVQIHSRDRATWYAPTPFRAMHGTQCQPFQEPAPVNTVRAGDAGSHGVASYDASNYRCRNHMMTALKEPGYGVIYVTPNAMVDFAGGEASVKFALATLRTSGRDWVDLWITPWEDNLALPLDRALPDMQGPPRRAIHVRMSAELRRSAFEAYVVDDFVETKLPVATAAGYESILTPLSTRRDTFELRISRTRLKFGMKTLAGPGGAPAAMTWVDAPLPSLAWTRGVVQFGHHSMNPALDANPAVPSELGGTWHWDDFQLAPAVPFTIVPVAAGAERYADAARPRVTFAAPAPAGGAYLRFAAYGGGLQVSADGGKTWVNARRQPEALDLGDRFHSYMTPVPANTQAVQFRALSGASGRAGWFVRDPALWVAPSGAVGAGQGKPPALPNAPSGD